MPRWLAIWLFVSLTLGCGRAPNPQSASITPTQAPTPSHDAARLIAADWDGDDYLLVVASVGGRFDLLRRHIQSRADERVMTLPAVAAPAVLRAAYSQVAIVPLFAASAMIIDRVSLRTLTTSFGGATSVEWLGKQQVVAVSQGEASDNGSIALFRCLPSGSWQSAWRAPAPRRLGGFSASCNDAAGQAAMVLERDPSPVDPQELITAVAWWQLAGDRLVLRQRHTLPVPALAYKGIGGDCKCAVSIDFDRVGNGSIVAVRRDSGAVHRAGTVVTPDVPVDVDLRLSPDGNRLLVVFFYSARPSSYQIVDVKR